MDFVIIDTTSSYNLRILFFIFFISRTSDIRVSRERRKYILNEYKTSRFKTKSMTPVLPQVGFKRTTIGAQAL